MDDVSKLILLTVIGSVVSIIAVKSGLLDMLDKLVFGGAK